MTAHAPLLKISSGVVEDQRTPDRIVTTQTTGAAGARVIATTSGFKRLRLLSFDAEISGNAGITGGGVSILTIRDGATDIHAEAIWFPDPSVPSLVPYRILWVPGATLNPDGSPRDGHTNGYLMAAPSNLTLFVGTAILGATITVNAMVASE